MIKLIVLMLSLALIACASAAKVDTSKAEPQCAQTCTRDYSSCASKFSLFPAAHKSACVDGFKACIGACPAKSPTSK
jgi:hypothetical protein